MLILVAPLLFSVMLLTLFSDSQGAFLFSVLVGTFVGIYQLILVLMRPRLIRFSSIMSLSLLLGYAAGTAMYVGGVLLTAPTLDLESNAFGLGYTQAALSVALMLVFLAAILLIFMSRLERPIFPNPEGISAALAAGKADSFIWAGLVLLAAAFVVGDLGYMGAQADEAGNITALGAMSFFIAPVILTIAAVSTVGENKKLRYSLLIVLALYLLVLFPLGRRVLAYSLLVMVIGFVSTGKLLPKFSAQRWAGLLAGGLLFMLIGYIGFHYFYALRLTVNSVGRDTAVFELLRESASLLFSEFDMIQAAMSGNLVERPFILSYLASFVSAQTIYPPLWGDELVYAVKTAIPSLFFPEKKAVLPGAAEEFVHPAFGFYVFDGPNTIVTAGLNDFGLAGAILYPILLVAIYIFIRRLLQGKVPALIYCLVMLRLIYQMLYVEQSLSGMLTTGLRDLAFMGIVSYLILKLPSLISRKANTANWRP